MLHFVSDFEKVLSHKVHFHRESTGSPPKVHLDSMWTPHGVLVESICSPKIPVCGLHVESTLYWDYGRMVVGLYVDYMWTPGGLQVDSTQTPWTLRCYRCTNTWTPGILLQNSMDTPWSPPQPVAQYNDLPFSPWKWLLAFITATIPRHRFVSANMRYRVPMLLLTTNCKDKC